MTPGVVDLPTIGHRSQRQPDRVIGSSSTPTASRLKVDGRTPAGSDPDERSRWAEAGPHASRRWPEGAAQVPVIIAADKGVR